jgi:DNA-binding NarL/FixJ family response regulator
MIYTSNQLENGVGRIERKLLLACLSSGFDPTIVYASGSHLTLSNFFRSMSNKGHFLGACTTGASALDLVARVKPGILAACDDLSDQSLSSLMRQVADRHPETRTCAFVEKIDQFGGGYIGPVVVSCQDLLAYPEVSIFTPIALATNTSYHSPSILSRLKEINQMSSICFESTFPLSLRERQLLEAYALGLSNKEIAERLSLSVRTVQTYSSNLLQKLGTNNRQKALLHAIELGFNALGQIVSGRKVDANS